MSFPPPGLVPYWSKSFKTGRLPIFAHEALTPWNRTTEPLPDIAEQGSEALGNPLYDRSPSALTCPACGGALWELKDGELLRYRCHVGHAFTGEGLLDEQDQNLEMALWTAVRALDENATLNRRMTARAADARLTGLAQTYEHRAATAKEQANLVRALLVEAPIADSVESVPTS
jgi:two-component system, chemotaxis family, protein-glutamate methylesterase/glutaminase